MAYERKNALYFQCLEEEIDDEEDPFVSSGDEDPDWSPMNEMIGHWYISYGVWKGSDTKQDELDANLLEVLGRNIQSITNSTSLDKDGTVWQV